MDNDSIENYVSSEVLAGVKRACSSVGITPETILIKKAANDIVDNSLEMLKFYSMAGARLLELAGLEGSESHRILCKCASADHLLSKQTHDAFILPVKEVMLKLAKVPFVDFLLGQATNAPYLVAVLAAATGALGGAGVYALRRAMNQGDAEVEAKYELAKAYREAARLLSLKIENGKSDIANVPQGLFV